MKVFFKTFGCRTNIYDTELMKTKIKDYEITEDENLADIIVVNSCTVTNGADSGVRSYIHHANKLGKKVFLTGCGAISKGEELFSNNDVFGVFGMSKKNQISDFLNKDKRFFDKGDLNFIEKDILKSYDTHTKAFLKIQEGCDFSCSYCIIPSVRGKARSLDEELILKEAKTLVENGFSELVLTGTNIGSYGKERGEKISDLLEKLGSISGIKRIRLGSLEPIQIDEKFFELAKEPWLEKHLHIALQHTNQKMLTIMRRRNSVKKDIKLFTRLAELGFALGSDIIVGHPGESEEIWEEALENFKNFPLTHLHAFIYSPRSGTRSATMKQDITGDIAKKRLKILQNIVFVNNLKFRKNQGELQVLIEQVDRDGLYTGFDQFYNKIKIKSDKNILKKWLRINNYEVKSDENFAEI